MKFFVGCIDKPLSHEYFHALSVTPARYTQSHIQNRAAMPPVPTQRINSTPPERSEDMRPSRLCQALFLSLLLLAGLAGCGQASSDNGLNLGSRASVDGPPLSKQGPPSGNSPLTPVTPAASPVPLVSVNGTGSASGTATVLRGENAHAVPVPSSEAGHLVEGLVVPEAMAQKLNSPSVLVRLRALEAWAREAFLGAIDLFILVFEDKDERVRARAQKLIEQDWARKAEAEKSGERGEK